MLCNKFPFFGEIKIFDKMPALYVSLWAFFGHVFSITSELCYLIPIIPLFFTKIKYICIGITLFSLFFFFAPKVPPIPKEITTGIFTISEIQEQKGLLHLKGTIVDLNTEASMLIKKSKEEEIAYHTHLLFAGKLKKKHHLQILPNTLKAVNPSRFSIPWMRFYLKKKILSFLEERNSNGEILSALLFGTPVPKHIALSIKRFGLSHLFAISGFHFNLITMLLMMLLRPFISPKWFHWTILTLLTLYALLIGPNPSLLRGFMAQAILFLGLALGKSSFGLNSLGLALLFITLFFPHLIPHLGFIFSFLITLAILLLYPLVSKHLLPEKPKILMGPLSLLLTVELASLPLNLTLFDSYPLLSPLYNLFVTPLISISLFLTPLSWIPYLSELTAIPLNLALMTFDIPSSVDLFIQTHLSPLFLIIYLTLLFSIAIIVQNLENITDISRYGDRSSVG